MFVSLSVRAYICSFVRLPVCRLQTSVVPLSFDLYQMGCSFLSNLFRGASFYRRHREVGGSHCKDGFSIKRQYNVKGFQYKERSV